MKPSLPKGTRDFLPAEAIRRRYLFGIIESVFRKFGYAPIETPAMESLSTLTGKYGEEGDRLLFRVLNNGDFLKNADRDALERGDSQALASSIAKRGMRYDLTVPFARFVVMHQNDLAFPFKRYQVQPVWRADRPQKGRYQEFYQCDADVVGSTSLVYEAEFVQIYDQAFRQLGIDVRIRINNRKILIGLAEVAGISEHLVHMTTAMDKWDKVGEAGVREDMIKRGLPEDAVNQLMPILEMKSLNQLESVLRSSETGSKGIEELKAVFKFLEGIRVSNEVSFDIRLARGLDYYTGCIFEVDAPGSDMGSLGGGGRYDDLTAVFGLKGTPGVGISFGAERIFDVMQSEGLFPENLKAAPAVLFVSLDDEALRFSFQVVSRLRAEGISADLYPEAIKLQKQMRFANQIGSPLVAIVGDEEIKTGSVMLKDMVTGDQERFSIDQLTKKLHDLV